MNKFLGTVGKGKATIVGIAATVLGILGQQDAVQTLVGVDQGLSQLTMAVGGLLAAFGWGRKAGYAAGK